MAWHLIGSVAEDYDTRSGDCGFEIFDCRFEKAVVAIKSELQSLKSDFFACPLLSGP
jgi:hypothetical protein